MFRLLFGREFRLSELCAVWDALLADSHDTSTLDLVPYLFCSILVYYRKQSERGETREGRGSRAAWLEREERIGSVICSCSQCEGL